MRILFAADEHPYSAYALKETMRLALNTWADVTLLGIHPTLPAREAWPGDEPLDLALQRYREEFLKISGEEGSPFTLTRQTYDWVPLKDGLWEEMLVTHGERKDLKVRMRVGPVAKGILTQAEGEGTDLIVLGCTKGAQCLWQGSPPVPQRVANDANCSVLLVKEEQPITRVVACLDQSYTSQESLEIVNQMVNLHGAELELIGLSQEGSMKKEVLTRLIEIGDYYGDRNIKVSTRLTEVAEFDQVISEARQDLLALWMGKKSVLDRFFPRDWVGRLVSRCQTSVLVMR